MPVFPTQLLTVDPKFQGVHSTAKAVGSKSKASATTGQLLLGKGGTRRRVGIGMQVHDQTIKRLGRLIRVIHAKITTQHMMNRVQTHLDLVAYLLLKIIR